MKQQTLTGFEEYGKSTCRAQFLADMDKIISWPQLAAAIRLRSPNQYRGPCRHQFHILNTKRDELIPPRHRVANPTEERSLTAAVIEP
jgi:hypothetical protein